ncbi:hypothetical protein [Alloactinosynnema sp. L-07]|nr:hypothetical protein [Alloactinosynnema sp. L-07]
MPHVNDRARLRECARILGAPITAYVPCRSGGRMVLDAAAPGQRAFQALLFAGFNSEGDHPWDGVRGRSMRELRLYVNWVAPQPDRLVIECTHAPRVVAHLLPHTQPLAAGATIMGGIPGLRITGYRKAVVELTHLPTGGRLDLRHGGGATSAYALRAIFASETDGTEHITTGDMGVDESAMYARWSPRRESAILSALMARATLFWTGFRHDTTVAHSKRSDCATRISWRRGRSTVEVARHLTDHVVGIPGARIDDSRSHEDSCVLTLERASVELDGPHIRSADRAGWHATSATSNLGSDGH